MHKITTWALLSTLTLNTPVFAQASELGGTVTPQQTTTKAPSDSFNQNVKEKADEQALKNWYQEVIDTLNQKMPRKRYTIRGDVRVTVDNEGKLLDVQWIKPSNDEKFNNTAFAALKNVKLNPPPKPDPTGNYVMEITLESRPSARL
ncbi:MAG: energy transducer TonB [Gloeobacterales cyanobacterium]